MKLPKCLIKFFSNRKSALQRRNEDATKMHDEDIDDPEITLTSNPWVQGQISNAEIRRARAANAELAAKMRRQEEDAIAMQREQLKMMRDMRKLKKTTIARSKKFFSFLIHF